MEVIPEVVKLLTQLPAQEAHHLGGVHDGINQLRHDFESMKDFLQDAEPRAQSDPSVKTLHHLNSNLWALVSSQSEKYNSSYGSILISALYEVSVPSMTSLELFSCSRWFTQVQVSKMDVCVLNLEAFDLSLSHFGHFGQ